MIAPAATEHGVLLESAQARRRLAGTDDVRLRARGLLDEGRGGSGDARQAAHIVEADALGLLAGHDAGGLIVHAQQQGHDLKLNWQIRDGYYLYRSKIELEPKNADLAAFFLPKGREHHDEFFGDSEVYEKALHITVPLRQASADAMIWSISSG
mgnify:CR=1 FL=1